jgi:hypothetical protein
MQAIPDVVSRQRNNVHQPYPESITASSENRARHPRPEIRTNASQTGIPGGASPSSTHRTLSEKETNPGSEGML